MNMELPSYYLTQPPTKLTPDTAAAFDQLLEESVQRGPDTAIDYKLDAPKWQFLCYLCDVHNLLLHGSGKPDIAEFEARQSNDVGEFGNRQAVYAASDGIWPMYFAIANRDGPVRSLTNACMKLVFNDGTHSQPYYFFSINDDAFATYPWRNGTIYILPRETFEQQALIPYNSDVHLEVEQWASSVSVKPLAKLEIAPEDFPFLSEVRGHNIEVVSERARHNPNGFPWLDEPVA